MHVHKMPLTMTQRGSTLVMSLLFLLVTTIIATGVWRVAQQQESMTGVERDYQLAFEAAEAALRDAEIDFYNACARITATSTAANCTVRSEPIEGLTGFGGVSSVGNGTCSEDGRCLGKFELHGTTKLYNAGPSIGLLEGKAAPEGGNRVTFGTYTRDINDPQQKIAGVSEQPAYVVEALQLGGSNGRQSNVMYRVSAIGFGRRADTRVTLQSFLDPN